MPTQELPLVMEPTILPFLRWAGSKRGALPVLSKFAPKEFGKYIEPFAGSACLFFYLQPSKAILADLNYNDLRQCELAAHYESTPTHALSNHPRCDGRYRVLASNLCLLKQ